MIIDDMAAPLQWSAVAADGVTPSLSLTVAASSAVHPLIGMPSLHIAGGSGARDHRARRSLADLDLAPFDELRLLWRATPGAGPDSPASPADFWAEIRLGAAALPVGAPGNAWQRFLPVPEPGVWEMVRLSLDDLPAGVRGAVNDLHIVCTADDRDFSADLAAILAVRPGLSEDVDSALLANLNLALALAGVPVPAEVRVAGSAAAGTRPLFSVVPYCMRYARERSRPGERAVDFTAGGYRLRPSPSPWDLHYAVEALADTRAEQAAMLDFATAVLPTEGALLVAGQRAGIEAIDAPDPHSGGFAIERALLHYRVRAWGDGGPARPVRPVQDLTLVVEGQERPRG
jgi:hypothetical protein